MRKLWFAHLAHALVVFPGGFGTFDELFEILTLAQTRKLDRTIPVLLYGSAYWKEVVNFDALVRHGTIASEDLRLFEFVDAPQAALELLQRRITLAARREAHARVRQVALRAAALSLTPLPCCSAGSAAAAVRNY